MSCQYLGHHRQVVGVAAVAQTLPRWFEGRLQVSALTAYGAARDLPIRAGASKEADFLSQKADWTHYLECVVAGVRSIRAEWMRQ
jgi:hypothetical protein